MGERLNSYRAALDYLFERTTGGSRFGLERTAALLKALGNPHDRLRIFHVAGTGETNWSGFARYIFQVSRTHGGPFSQVKDIVSADYRTRAKRPSNSCLSTDKFDKIFGWRAPHWQACVNTVVRRIIAADYPGFPSKAPGKRKA